MLSNIKKFIAQIYYELFDQLILYPLMSFLPRKYNMKFMNLGFAPVRDSLSTKEQISIDIIEHFLGDENNSTKAHCFLYEKALSLCPGYPQFKNTKDLLEVGCGFGGGLEWIQR